MRPPFALLLRASMTAHRATIPALARALGATPGTVQHWRRGRLPSMEMATRLAETLEDPELLDAVRMRRSRVCPQCKRQFVAATDRRLFCEPECAAIYRVLHGSGRQHASVAGELRRVTARYREAVAAFCLSCEPDRTCRNRACELVTVTPFPVADGLGVVRTLDGRRSRWDDPRQHELAAERMQRRWAARRAEEVA